MPFTTTVSASTGSRPAGTRTRSAAETMEWLAQPPVLVAAATLVPTSAWSTSVPTAATVPTRS